MVRQLFIKDADELDLVEFFRLFSVYKKITIPVFICCFAAAIVAVVIQPKIFEARMFIRQPMLPTFSKKSEPMLTLDESKKLILSNSFLDGVIEMSGEGNASPADLRGKISIENLKGNIRLIVRSDREKQADLLRDLIGDYFYENVRSVYLKRISLEKEMIEKIREEIDVFFNKYNNEEAFKGSPEVFKGYLNEYHQKYQKLLEYEHDVNSGLLPSKDYLIRYEKTVDILYKRRIQILVIGTIVGLFLCSACVTILEFRKKR